MNRVEREVGGGIGMGNTCNSMADSCQNPLQYCKVISLQLIKINEKKNSVRVDKIKEIGDVRSQRAVFGFYSEWK